MSTRKVTELRILFDKNVPVGVRRFLTDHDVKAWELLTAAEAAGFDVLVTSDQNIRYQQNRGVEPEV